MVHLDDRLILHAKMKVSFQAMEKHGGNASISLLHGWSQLERMACCVNLTTDGPQFVMPLLMLYLFPLQQCKGDMHSIRALL